MWRYVRSLAVVGLLCLLAGHRLGPGIAQAQAVPAARSAPDEVLAALPEGATAIAAVAADLMGNGEQQWVVRYTLEPGGFFGDANAAIIAAESDGWAVVHTMTIEGGNLGGMTLLDVDGITAVLLEALIGAHAIGIEIARWDGAAFQTILADTSNAPSFDLADLDGDSVPEVLLSWSPYCEAYAVSPWLTTVYRWDGTRYLEATQAFPDVLAADWEGVLLAEQYAEDWTARGRACLAGAYGFLAYEGGDVESAAAECARAREIDPEWWADWAATFCP